MCLSRSVMSDSETPWTARFLCPWGFSRQEYWSALLQGIFPIQGLKPGLLPCRQIIYHLSHQGRSKFKGGQLWKSLSVCHPDVFPLQHILVFDNVYIWMRWIASFISSISHAPLPSFWCLFQFYLPEFATFTFCSEIQFP